jgi:CBS domain-containing protein
MYLLRECPSAKIVDTPNATLEIAMRVDSLMSRKVRTCAPGDSLDHAAQMMWQEDCGCLPVEAGNSRGLAGIITDRDICMSALFQGKPLHELRVESAMARDVLHCRPEDSLAEAERKMTEARIRRLPVITADGTLVGMLSLADLAREAARQQNARRHSISGSEVCSTLAGICSPAADRLPA